MRRLALILFVLLLATLSAKADTPPARTTTQDSADSSSVLTEHFVFPNFTGSHSTNTFTLGVNAPAGGGTGTSTAFTAGSVVFAGSSGIYNQNNSKLFWDNTNYRLGIGALAPDSALTISNNVSALPAAIAGTYTLIHAGSLDGVSNTVLFDSFGGPIQYINRRADGMASSPTAVQSGDLLGQFGWLGYGATSYQTSFAAKIVSSSLENWTDSTGAANLQFYTRPSGTAGASTVRMTLDQNGNLGLGTVTPAYFMQMVQSTNGTVAQNITNANTGTSNNENFSLTNDSGASAALSLFGNAFSATYLQNAARISGTKSLWLVSDVNAASGGSDNVILSPGGYNNTVAQATPSLFTAINYQDTGISASAAGAPLSITSGQVLTSGITNAAVTSTTATATGTTAAVLLTTTPAAGTYLVTYSGNITASSAGGNVLTVSILVGGTQQTQSIRTALPFSSSALGVFQNMTIATNAIVSVNGSQAIAIQGQTSSGTVTTTQRELDIVRLQ